MGVTEKDRTVSDVFNSKPTLTQGSTIYIYIYICVCVYVYIYFFPPWGLTALIFIPKATATPTFPFCLLVQFHCPESADGEAVRTLALVALQGSPSRRWGGWVGACVWRGCAWVCARRPPAPWMRLAQAHSCFCAVLDKSTGLRH